MAASVISVVVGDRVDAGIILTIVIVSAGLGFVQEARSATAVQALRARLALQASAIRDGAVTDVPVTDLVVGDVVLLAAGDIVPADAHLLETNHLYVDESAMTGESAPVAKAVEAADAADAAAAPPPPAAATDGSAPDAAGRAHLVFFGTSVISGTGRAVVVATGPRTEYGLIARRLQERPPRNDFERGVRRFGLLIARIILLLVMGVFAADVALQKPLLDSFLFALALAVGLTPELLPAIVTVNLSRGARALASHGVLVRRLPAIQNLGSMTVLCTDKTGTLTEGHLTLVRSIGGDGEAAPGAVAAAWLNSHFETGFSDPLDEAILAAAQAPVDESGYHKVAELPFDFQRRCLSVVLTRPDGTATLICKGAPEAVMARSTQVRGPAAPQPLDAPRRATLEAQIAAAAAQGQRAIAVATRSDAVGPGLTAADERDLVFEGLLLFSDPPKAGITETLAELQALRVDLRIVTGDNDLVARAVAESVGLPVRAVLTGDQIEALSPTAFVARAQGATIFARVDPDQKLRVIQALQERGAVVGYLGDGINDAPPLHVADVGISVDNATDVARAAADVILLQASLAAIAQGVREGRRTFGNTLKYIRMGTSSNFGNMLSMAGAALILPFLPMLPSQILLNNLIYDASQTAIPADTIDPETEQQPARWDIDGIERFMIVFGPISSVFDYLTFGLLLAGLGSSEAAFHTGWFIESLATQVLVIFVIRTGRVPFWRSRPSRWLVAAAVAAVAVAVALPLSPLGGVLGFTALPPLFWLALPVLVGSYLVLVEAAKWFLLRHATLVGDRAIPV